MDYTELKELLVRNRSIRRFREDERIREETLNKIVSLACLCASGRNLQPLKYHIVSGREECDKMFPTLQWAGYLVDWPGPKEGERPAAYLLQGLDTRITKNCLCDEGLQLQAITLGAASLGLGGCIIKSFNAPLIKEMFRLPEWFSLSYVVALGYPAETVVLESVSADTDLNENIKYYRTPDGVHHVPKRQLKDILI